MLSRAFLFSCLFAACSTTSASDGSASSTGSDTTGVGNEEFPDAAATLICGLIFECACTDPGYVDEAACVTAIEEATRFDQEKAQNLGLTYDPACGQSVLDDFDRRECAITLLPGGGTSCASACRRYVGDKGVGEMCSEVYLDWHDCGQGLDCETNAGGMRLCVDPCGVGLSDGAECLDSMFQELGTCAYDLYCNRDTRLCAPIPAPGEPCGGQMTCDADSFCDATTTPVCASKREPGEMCSFSDWCTSDAYCDSGLSLCTALPGVGAPCAPGALCNPYAICVNQTCETGEAIACTGLDALAG